MRFYKYLVISNFIALQAEALLFVEMWIYLRNVIQHIGSLSLYLCDSSKRIVGISALPRLIFHPHIEKSISKVSVTGTRFIWDVRLTRIGIITLCSPRRQSEREGEREEEDTPAVITHRRAHRNKSYSRVFYTIRMVRSSHE